MDYRKKSLVETRPPFCRYTSGCSREGVRATEKAVYTIVGQKDDRITIAKRYELTTTPEVNGKPQFQAAGDGNLVFDIERGAFQSMTFNVQVTVRQATKTEEVPFHLTYQLVSEEERAAEAKKAEEARIAAKKRLEERHRPMTDAEIDTALADLASGDSIRAQNAMTSFAEKSPPKPNPKVAKALEAAMLDPTVASFVRSQAVKALKTWGFEDNVAGLIKALRDEDYGVKNEAVEVLTKCKPAKAIEPIAQLFAEHFRGPRP